MNKKSIGNTGEDLATEFLFKKGFQILDRNYAQRCGEIDIIAFDPQNKEYVFVEVKARKNTAFGYPEEFVDDQKMEKITRTAYTWLDQCSQEEPEWRIDIIGVIGSGEKAKIEHLVNVG